LVVTRFVAKQNYAVDRVLAVFSISKALLRQPTKNKPSRLSVEKHWCN